MIVAALTQAAESGVAPRVVDSAIDSLQDYLYIGGHWALGVSLWTLQLAIRQEVGDRRGEGTTLNNLGLPGRESWDVRTRRPTIMGRRWPSLREVGDRRGEGTTLSNLGGSG